ncbi:hypothetical protein N9K26_04875, partial [Flavobacteriales bacterium]|nr:hypothetical protein [Flavobacteriales bacterium]
MKQDSSLIIEKYANSQQVTDLKNIWSQQDSHVHLKGILGSSLAFFASAATKEIDNLQLFVFPEKEDAVYFYNTLENINPEKGGKKY